jgi:hypothetical protein
MHATQLFLLVAFALLAFASTTAAQEEIEAAPPPTKIITREERSRIDSERDLKGKTRAYIDLMNTRLAAAERRSSAEEFNAMFGELGAFQALMEGCIATLQARDASGNKAFDQYKKLDITLRTFGTRIELIRRELPVRFENYMLSLMRAVRDTRSKAVDPLFADTVVPNLRSDQ